MKCSLPIRELPVLIPLFLLILGIGSVDGKDGQKDGSEAAGQVAQEGIEVLARGPLHEAFAEQVNHDPQPGVTVGKTPPTPINEEPPEYKPEGNNVLWISGYWAWDDEREDFIWISGVWRTPPDGHRWVPGYWYDTTMGFQWVSGFWQSAVRREVDYVEQPPTSLERGPATEAPTKNHFWVSGCWVARGNWVWRPGHWRRFRLNHVWMPDRYSWTPGGCVFIAGHWDRRLVLRGQLFAPIYLAAAVRPAFVYRPACVIDVDAIGVHLFVRPRYSHYYYGDYYAPRYADLQIYSALNFHTRFHGCDPLLSYASCHYARFGVSYFHHLHHWHNHFHNFPHHRPGHTFSAQLAFAGGGGSFLSISVFSHSIRNYHHNHHNTVAVTVNHREEIVGETQGSRELAQQRQLTERENITGLAGNNKPGSGSVARAEGSLKLPAHRPLPPGKSKPSISPAAQRPEVLSLPPGSSTDKLVLTADGRSGRPALTAADIPASIRTVPTRPTATPRVPIANRVGSSGLADRPVRPGTKAPTANYPRPTASDRGSLSPSRPSGFPSSPGSRGTFTPSRPSSSARPSPSVRPTRPSGIPSSSGSRGTFSPSRPSSSARPAPSVRPTRPSFSPSRPSPGRSTTIEATRPSPSVSRPSSGSRTIEASRPSPNANRPSRPSPGSRGPVAPRPSVSPKVPGSR